MKITTFVRIKPGKQAEVAEFFKEFGFDTNLGDRYLLEGRHGESIRLIEADEETGTPTFEIEVSQRQYFDLTTFLAKEGVRVEYWAMHCVVYHEQLKAPFVMRIAMNYDYNPNDLRDG